MPLLIAEGANRFSAPQKKQRFAEARGECGEVAAVADLLGRFGWAGPEDARSVIETADRVAALLTGLVRRCGCGRACYLKNAPGAFFR
ncbi:MAG: four helix bundle protein [Planctomycetes bacterium]|nr:four helix bundle protein [Planctomycetota bacterium]